MSKKFTKIFGIGLPKTGTTTLGKCFEILGYSKAPYNRNIINEVADGKYLSSLREIERYDMFEDWPWPLLYKELYSLHPKAGFILTIRKDADTWLKSIQKHTDRISNKSSEILRKKLYKCQDPFSEEECFLNFYLHHILEVEKFFEVNKGSLLKICWENGDGWDKICAFTNDSLPKVEIPHLNDSKSLSEKSIFRKIIKNL